MKSEKFTRKEFNLVKKEIEAGITKVAYEGQFPTKWILRIYLNEQKFQRGHFTKTQLAYLENVATKRVA